MRFEWLWEMVGPKTTGAGVGEMVEMLENLESLSLLGGRLVLVLVAQGHPENLLVKDLL